jgi:D-alanyl-D-alanine carboxypeptidase
VLRVPLDEQLDIVMANAVDNIAVTHRRMAVFTDRGWRWGGYWRTPIDYQHFER